MEWDIKKGKCFIDETKGIRSYMLSGVKEWLTEGEWNEKNICDDIDKMLEVKKGAEPKDLVRNLRLIDLEEDTIKKGLSEVLEMAYAGY